jgi:hypothetical protein
MLRLLRHFPMVCVCSAALLAAAAIQPGERFPQLTGKSLAGPEVTLPAADMGSKRVVVFSFSKASGDDSRLWNEHLAKDYGPNGVLRFRVIVLQSVPRLFRGMAVSGIKSGVPRGEWDRVILLYQDEQPWKERLRVSNDKYAYVVLVDGEGRVEWMGSGPFSDAVYAHLKDAVARIANHP